MTSTDPRCFAIRAIVQAKVPGIYEDKPRYCVVLRVEHDRLEVAYGQASSSGDRDLVIKKDSADGRRYRVTKDTYFRPGNIAIIPRQDVIAFLGLAPNAHLLTLQAFAQTANLAAAPIPDGKSSREQARHQQPAAQLGAMDDGGADGSRN